MLTWKFEKQKMRIQNYACRWKLIDAVWILLQPTFYLKEIEPGTISNLVPRASLSLLTFFAPVVYQETKKKSWKLDCNGDFFI